jgi:hypothetical protein
VQKTDPAVVFNQWACSKFGLSKCLLNLKLFTMKKLLLSFGLFFVILASNNAFSYRIISLKTIGHNPGHFYEGYAAKLFTPVTNMGEPAWMAQCIGDGMELCNSPLVTSGGPIDSYDEQFAYLAITFADNKVSKKVYTGTKTNSIQVAGEAFVRTYTVTWTYNEETTEFDVDVQRVTV